MANADKNAGIPHFESKRKVEEHIQRLGVTYTITAPAFFMENLFAPWMLPQLQRGELAMPMPAKRSLQMIALRNVGDFNAAVLEGREPFLGLRIDLASDEVTGERAAEVLSQVAGRRIVYREVHLDQARSESEDMAKMYEWFDREGYSADIAGLRTEYPEVGWKGFEEWARAQDWVVLPAGAGPAAQVGRPHAGDMTFSVGLARRSTLLMMGAFEPVPCSVGRSASGLGVRDAARAGERKPLGGWAAATF